jgi:hypothetical protein
LNQHQRAWTEADYTDMSWHDNHVHGFTILEGEYGEGELALDIDYILEWRPAITGRYTFLIAPATLCFRNVTDLRISLDYVNPNAGITPFSISSIDRQEHTYANGHTTFLWSIGVNWPEGVLTFAASGYLQKIRAEPIETSQQSLTHAQRRDSRLY